MKAVSGPEQVLCTELQSLNRDPRWDHPQPPPSDPPRGPLPALPKTPPLGPKLGSFWAFFGPFLAYLAMEWTPGGTILGLFGPFYTPLGPILMPF